MNCVSFLRKIIKKSLFILLIQSTFVAILLELTSRILVSQNILIDIYKDSHGKNIRDTNWRTEKDEWGAWHKPNYSDRGSKECFDVKYQSNSQGARDDEFIISEGDIGFLIGDSFAEGFGVNKEFILDSQIESVSKLNIFNLGSGHGFGPVQYSLVYKNFAKKYPHKFLIITFLPANDFDDNDPEEMYNQYNNKRYRPYYKLIENGKYDIQYPPNAIKTDDIYSQMKELSKENFNTIKFLKKNLSRYSYFYRVLISIRHLQKGEFNAEFERQGFFNHTQAQVNAANYFIEEIIKDSLKFDVEMVVLFAIPVQSEAVYFFNKKPSLPHWIHKFKSLEKKYKSFKFVNGLEFIPNDTNEIEKLYLNCDGHWSKDGHAWAGKIIFDTINSF